MNKSIRLVFCTYPSIYSSVVLDRLIAAKNIEVVAIIISTRRFKPGYNSFFAAIKQIHLSGWRYATYLFLITDVYRWMQILNPFAANHLQNLQQKARHNCIPVLDTQDINNEESVKFLKAYQPEVLLASHFNQLVKKPVLDFPGLLCLNIHPSMLPAYRGVDPVFHAMLDGEPQLGVTLHKMAEDFDTGETLSQQVVAAANSKSLLINNIHLFSKGAELSIKWLMGKNLQQIQQNIDEGDIVFSNDYDSWPTKKAVRSFRSSGNYLIKLRELWPR